MDSSTLDDEIELIASSLLPSERLEREIDGEDVVLTISSEESRLSLRVIIGALYPKKGSLSITVKGEDIGREEAEGWKIWSTERLEERNVEDDYPLFQILTSHFLPILASDKQEPQLPAIENHEKAQEADWDSTPHHALFTSHHLIAPSKRKDLHSLSSQLSLTGFAKVGYPGIIYAIGQKQDLIEWIREVKSWQWLALRVRISPEPIDEDKFGGRGKDSGARGGKGRGEWKELEKIGEAVEWLRARGNGKGSILTDLGMGVGSGK